MTASYLKLLSTEKNKVRICRGLQNILHGLFIKAVSMCLNQGTSAACGIRQSRMAVIAVQA